jgi:hypothetical protein
VQIQEGAYLQCFCGYREYDDSKPPFDLSLMVYFRKRLTPKLLGEINELIIARQQPKSKEEKIAAKITALIDFKPALISVPPVFAPLPQAF